MQVKCERWEQSYLASEWVLSPLWKWNWPSSAKFKMACIIDPAIALEEIYVGERETQTPKDIG